MPRIGYEQAVYGSFAFRPHQGYGLLAHSPGCRDDWLKAFAEVCRRYGQPASDETVPPGTLFALRLSPRGPWAVVGVACAGDDDHGRPGTLAFHGLFVEPRDLRRSPLGPFALTSLLRSDWGPDTPQLARGQHYVAGVPRWRRRFSRFQGQVQYPGQTPPDPAAPSVARALLGGTRVAVLAREPVLDLARDVWLAGGPALQRRGCSVATLAFAPDLAFSLAAYPRPGLAGDEGSFARLEDLQTHHPLTASPAPPPGRRRRRLILALLAVALLVVAVLAIAGAAGRLPVLNHRPVAHHPSPPPPPPRPAALLHRAPVLPDDPDDRRRLREALVDVAARFGVAPPPPANAGPTPGPGTATTANDDRAALLRRLADTLQYDGPWLSEAERVHLRRDGRPAAARALAWHDHLAHFAPGRSLPPGREQLPPGPQVDALAAVFDLSLDPELPPADRVFALADALATPWPVRPSPELTRSYPALAHYARFLARLPRR